MQQLANNSKKTIYFSYGICLVVARALKSTKKAVYLQLDPGNGKTYALLLYIVAKRK